MAQRTTTAIDSYVNSLDIQVSTARLLSHLRETKGKEWNMDSYKAGGGPEAVSPRRLKYLLNEADNPALYREEVEFLTSLSNIPPSKILGLPDVLSLDYAEAVEGLKVMVREGRVEELKSQNVPDLERWVKTEYLLNLTFRLMGKYPSKKEESS